MSETTATATPASRKVSVTKITMIYVAVGCAVCAAIILVGIIKKAAPEVFSPLITVLQYYLIGIGALDGAFILGNGAEHMAKAIKK